MLIDYIGYTELRGSDEYLSILWANFWMELGCYRKARKIFDKTLRSTDDKYYRYFIHYGLARIYMVMKESEEST